MDDIEIEGNRVPPGVLFAIGAVIVALMYTGSAGVFVPLAALDDWAGRKLVVSLRALLVAPALVGLLAVHKRKVTTVAAVSLVVGLALTIGIALVGSTV